MRASRKTKRGQKHPKRLFRHISLEPLETRRLLAATGSISGFVFLDPARAGAMASGDAGFAGMTVELQSVGSSGGTTLVSPGGIVTTGTDGSYSFTGVAAGTYQVQIAPSVRLDVGTLSPGSAGGTAGAGRYPVDADRRASRFRLQLRHPRREPELHFRADGLGHDRHAGQLPVQFGAHVRLRFKAPTPAAPAARLIPRATRPAGRRSNVAPSATVNSTESPNLLWLTATIENPVGSGDQLAATIPSGSGLSSNFSGDVLTISGPASAATYQAVLQSITYSTTSTSTGTSSPTIAIVASDGTTESDVYVTSISRCARKQCRAGNHGEPDGVVGQCRPERDLHGRGQRHAHAHRAVGSQHGQRFQQHYQWRRLQRRNDRHADDHWRDCLHERLHLRGGLHQQRRLGHQQFGRS